MVNVRKAFNKNICATLILICFICIFFALAALQVNRLATDACFNTLDDAADQVALDIRIHMTDNQEQLEAVADLMAQCMNQNFENVQKHLGTLRQHGMLSDFSLLLPDNRLVSTDENNAFEGTLNYYSETEKVPYISDIIDLPNGSGERGFYQAVPVEADGETIGILYGYVRLDDFADSIAVTAFDGKAQIFVADGNTGDFLVDTWHDTLGNVFDDEMLNRKVKSGYDFNKMKQDFVEGNSGNIAFWSNTAGEYFYSCYMSVGINKWMVQLTVLESVVFANAVKIRSVLYFIAGIESVTFIVYFLWVLSQAGKEMNKKNERLAQSFYMYDVQQTLFDAHKDTDLMTVALQKVSNMLTADTAFFLTLDGEKVKEIYFSSSADANQKSFLGENAFSRDFSQIYDQLASGESLTFYSDDISQMADMSYWKELSKRRISNLMLVPVINITGEPAGILGCINMKKRWTNCILLECVSRNFMMALRNMTFYRQIERMGMMDALTCLRNRNCYENSLDYYEEKYGDTLGVLYIDANGLHELNNTLGHAAGDAMLIFIADSLKKVFPSKDCYRIGGDEFVVFCADCSKKEIRERVEYLNESMSSSGYSISIGEAWLSDFYDVKDMISAAEKAMYEQKRAFYQKAGNLSKARLMNRKLEDILMQKKDNDAFLDIIASRFIGTYIVDMKTDRARVIYKPSYFEDILGKNQYHFLPSMEIYVHTYVVDEDQKEVLDLLDYEAIRKAFRCRNIIKHHYRKKDGVNMILCIHPTRDYGQDNEQTIWVFEETSK